MAALRFLLLTFTSRFVIDFLSIRKVIIFSAIATDDRHPLRSRSIHQNAANCMTIRFRYIAQPRGVRKTYCARSRNDVRRLTSRSNGMPSKKIMESLRTFAGGNSWGGAGGPQPPNFWPTTLFSGFSHNTYRKVASEVVLMGSFMSVIYGNYIYGNVIYGYVR